MSLVILLLKL